MAFGERDVVLRIMVVKSERERCQLEAVVGSLVLGLHSRTSTLYGNSSARRALSVPPVRYQISFNHQEKLSRLDPHTLVQVLL